MIKNLVRFALAVTAYCFPPFACADDRVVLQLRWDHQFQFAGYYAANWQGFFKDAGIDVEIRSSFAPGGRFRSAISEVAESRADFGTAGADLLIAVDKGRPLVVVASIFQRSPVAFYAKPETGLRSPADLPNLRVGVHRGGIANVELRAMLRAEGINPARVNLRQIQGKLGIDDVANGLLDVASGFTISAGWLARNRGIRLTALHPATYGVDFYGSALFTHRSLIERNPALVQRFVSASLKGWEYALTHAEAIADRISEELPRTIPLDDAHAFNRFQIEPVRALTHYPLVELGHSNVDRWRRMHAAILEAGIITGPFNAERLFFDPEKLAHARSERILSLSVIGLVSLILGGSIVWLWQWSRSKVARRRTEGTLQATEKLVRTIAERIPGTVYRRVMHKDGSLTYSYISTDQNRELLKLPSTIDASSSDFASLIIPQDRAVWEREIRHSAENLAPFDVEVRLVLASGKVRWCHSLAHTHRDEEGNIVWDGVALDITDRKLAEDQARMHQAELARVLRVGSMDEMASALAHEMNQPLSAIYNFSRGSLRRMHNNGASPAELTAVLTKISEQAERASKFIRNLADLVRKGEPNRSETDVNEMVRVVTELLQTDLEDARVDLRLDLNDGFPRVLLDRIELEQVLMNLVRNAIEAMLEVPTRRRVLTITTAMHGDGNIEIVVRDTGPGFVDKESQLFTPFYSTKPKGMGMGLAISRTIVSAHEGRIWAEANCGHGAAFHITLPIQKMVLTDA